MRSLARHFPLAATALTMLAGMFLYYGVREFFLPGLPKWPSHHAAILYSTLLATFITYVIVRRLRHIADAVEKSERRFRALTDNAPDIITVLGADGTITYESESVRRELGFTPEDLVGRNVFEFIHPDDQSGMREIFAGIVATPGKDRTSEVRFRHQDGTWRILEARGVNLLTDPAVAGIVVNCRDVTAHRQAEEARQTLQGRLEHLFSVSPVVVFACNPACGNTPTFMSENVEVVFGHSAGQFVGNADAWPALIHPEDHEPFFTAGDALYTTGRCVREYRVRHGDGSWAWVREEVRLMRDPDSAEPSELVGCRIDITERKWAETEARRARDEAERANQAKTDFLARTSHELRTPLNAILGFGQLLEMSGIAPRDQECVEQILRAGRHLLELVDEVLDLSGIESGRLTFSLEPVHLGTAVSRTLDLIRPLAEAHGVSLSCAAAEIWGGLHVFADVQRLKQVLLNLLSNAVKYNHRGGGVFITCEEDLGDRIRLMVEDTGIGIPADRFDRLFTPFERLGAERTEVEGVGLGLALSRRLIDAMGGTIGVESTPEAGSIFWFKLPRATPATPTAAPSPAPSLDAPSPDAPAQPATVLYIEDNLSNLKLIESLFAQRPGTNLIVAMQGRTGLDLARLHQPDLILLDLHLPDLMGAEVLSILQADAATRDLPVVILTADATSGQATRLLAAGARDYLTKPLDVRNFLAVIDRVLGAPGERQKEKS